MRNFGTLGTLVILAIVAVAHSVAAQEAPLLVESIPPGSIWKVSTRVKLSGELSVPVEEGQPAKPVRMTGESRIDYDERLLPDADPASQERRALRVYSTIDFRRSVGDRTQEIALRPVVSRMVVSRRPEGRNCFSPDGPLTWGELDMLRTDIFLPGLSGFLPGRAVKPGDTWRVGDAALRELTDLERLDKTTVEARYERPATIGGRILSHISFAGSVSGINEDGPTRQKLEGLLYFDPALKVITYLSLRGTHEMLDKDGKTIGTVSGLYTLTREPNPACKSLSDETVKHLRTEPDDERTMLMYEDAAQGISFDHSRRWRVNSSRGRQVTLEDNNGAGLLLTLEPLARLPTIGDYQRESATYLKSKGIAVLRQDAPKGLDPNTERATLRMQEGQKDPVWMDYYRVRRPLGGMTIAARLPETDPDASRREVERIAASVRITIAPAVK